MISDQNSSKKFQCQRCERRFVRREHLSRHERSHTKERPYSCSVCSQAFTRRDLLVRHNRLYHVAPVDVTTTPSPSSMSHSSSHSMGSHCVSVSVAPNMDQDMLATQTKTTTTTSPQNQTYDEMSASYTLSSDGAPLEMDAPSTRVDWDGDPNGADIDVVQSGLLIDASIGDSWMGASNDGDFSSFLDGITLPRHQFSDYVHFEQPLPFFSGDPILSLQSGFTASTHEQELQESSIAETSRDSLTQFGSRLPSLQPEDHATNNSPPLRRPVNLTNISIESREAVAAKLAAFTNVIPVGFRLVSRHSLSRYIAAFITGFHEHLPFLHIPTLSVETASVELTLALAAIGAQYCREPEKGLEIFKVAKAICIERISRRDQKNALTSSDPFNRDDQGRNFANSMLVEPQTTTFMSYMDRVEEDGDKPIETAQALLILMAMATWFKWRPPAREAPAIRSLLETLMRDEGLKKESISENIAWEDWIEYEGKKRTKFVVFCFFNLHSIVFDIPPMILNGKIDMELPCMESEWKALDARAWREARALRKPEPKFLNAFSSLFKGEGTDLAIRKRFSSLGSYILIHALIQHIWLTQELRRSQAVETQREKGHLRAADVAALEHALKSWQYSWEFNPESSVNPLSPHGPLSFNSTALLRLAYIRINIDTGPICSLGSCNPTEIATSIWMSPPVQRSKRMTRAALHCAHALSIPIKLGINSIAHTRLFWSIQHALCSLECALLLTKWLESVTHPNLVPPLAEAERRLLGFVIEMVAETEHAAPSTDLLQDNKQLSTIVVRVWARLFRADDIWEMVNLIGRSLEVYANMLES